MSRVTTTHRPPADERATVPLTGKRARVLTVLQDAGAPLTADDVAGRLDVHPNTARFHLDALTRSGLAVRTIEERDVPGRPRVLFAPSDDAPAAGDRNYRLLAEMLARTLAELPQPAEIGERAGEAWGHRLVDNRPRRRMGADRALHLLVERLGEVGFTSHTEEVGGRTRLAVTHCPFLEVAGPHREVVCALHLGMARGLLEAVDAPVQVDELEPLVEPGLCLATLAPRP